jgi:hypothetical protein
MANCTYTELQNITGSDLSTTILGAIIDQADREIEAYLDKYGLDGSSSVGAVKAASLKLSQAGVYELSGNTSQVESLYNPVKELRKAAYEILSNYVSANASSSSTLTRVRAVHGI